MTELRQEVERVSDSGPVTPDPERKLPPETWSRYDAVNAAVADEFFSGRYAGRAVYLDLEDEVLERIAAAAKAPVGVDPREALLQSVVPTLIVVGGRRIFGRHRQRRLAWRISDREGTPPHLGVLAFLSLVAESMRGDGALSASAYYARFIEMIGQDPSDTTLRKFVIKGHRDDVVPMWAELNGWLERDRTRGLPTAFAFDHRTYIGPALTQALVREADRRAFPELFASARLSPGQDLSQDDMLRLLQDWLPKAHVSHGLKSMCRQREALERVADVALVELVAWDGSGRRDAVHTQGLRLAGRMRLRPRRQLELALRARLPEGDATFEAAGTTTTISLIADGGTESVGQTGSAALALTNVVTVRAARGSVVRAPRRLVILAADERGLLAEVDRALLGARHVLLAPENLVDRLARDLVGVASPGWSTHTKVKGLPQGWALFADVEIVALGDFKHQDLTALIPTAWSHLSLHDGFRLPGVGRWLASSPPELSVSVLEGGEVDVVVKVALGAADTALAPTDVDAECEGEEPDVAEDALAEAASEVPASTVLRRRIASIDRIAIADVGLDAGEYLFSAVRHDDDQLIARARMRLVSPDPAVIADGRGHQPDGDPLWPITASAGGELRGGHVPAGLSSTTSYQAAVTVPETLDTTALAAGDASAVDEELVLPVTAPSCFLTGSHYFKLPKTTRKGTQGACEHCKVEKYFPPRPVSRFADTTRTVRLPKLPEAGEALDDDLLLALSAVGSGSRGVLERLVEQVDDDPWALDERARTLSALGHLDLAFDPRGRIKSFATAPPALVLGARQEAFLTGWRSPRLLDGLRSLVEQFGGQFTVTPNDHAPSRALVSAVQSSVLASIAAELGGRERVSLPLVQDAASTIAAALPAARELLPHLPVARGEGPLQWLRPGAWAWDDVDHVGLPGAYRTRRLPRRTYVFDGTDLRACEPRLARWMFIPRTTPHLAYDPKSQTLTVPLGGRLPGLWERSAVLCSGRPPQKSAGRLVYRDVSPDVAAQLAATLATRTEDISLV